MGVMVLGKALIGPVADRWGAKMAMAGACVLFAISIVILTVAVTYPVVIIFAALYGFACSAPLTINPLLTSGNLGMKNFGAIYGILTITMNVGGAVGPVGAGMYFDRYGTYLPVFYVFAVFLLLAIACTAFIRPAYERLGAAAEA